MTSWYDFYKERQNDRYQKHLKSKYRPFLEMFGHTRGAPHIELGCGAGNITRIIREEFESDSDHLLIDLCPKMLGLAIENNSDSNCFFKCADITKHAEDYLEGAVIHSHGVLEHFEDEQIQNILALGDSMGDFQVHYVPSAKYLKPSRGDERLMTPAEWKEIIEPVLDRFYIREFNDGFDLAIVTGMEM